MKSKVLCVIPARYGSTRLPGKPLLEIKGIPLVMWAYNRALESAVFDRVCVATDDSRIAETVERFGGKAVMTSPAHKRGTDRVNEAAADSVDCTHIVNLQGDEPDVPVEIIRDFVSDLERIDHSSLLTLVSNATIREVESPHVVKAVLGFGGDALYFSRALIPFDRGAHQGAFYKHHGIYGFTREGLRYFCSLSPGSLELRESLEQLRALEYGMKIKCLVRDFTSEGIDTPEDFAQFRKLHE
ncbi:MAG: 3-deoxy-manno-octulosonate cytidylyltransferase [Chitinispirillaceae bacterium]